MTGVAALSALSLACVVASHFLARAQWPVTAPRLGVVLWQAIGLTWGLATTGALLGFGLLPYKQGVFFGLVGLVTSPDVIYSFQVWHMLALLGGLVLLTILVAVLVAAGIQVYQARRRHRVLLSLVGHGDPIVPGVLVLDHPSAAAYCVPGLRSQVVVSEGTLRLLDPAELQAVLAHEQAHGRERHDLVLLPFVALHKVLPTVPLVSSAIASVALLIEMCADDRARRSCAPKPLATALLRFGAAGGLPAPSGALAALGESAAVLARVNRLLTPGPMLPVAARRSILVAAAILAVSSPLLWMIAR